MVENAYGNASNFYSGGGGGWGRMRSHVQPSHHWYTANSLQELFFYVITKKKSLGAVSEGMHSELGMQGSSLYLLGYDFSCVSGLAIVQCPL